jgi:hypothetical protein
MCWHQNPQLRPSFSDIFKSLKHLEEEMIKSRYRFWSSFESYDALYSNPRNVKSRSNLDIRESFEESTYDFDAVSSIEKQSGIIVEEAETIHPKLKKNESSSVYKQWRKSWKMITMVQYFTLCILTDNQKKWQGVSAFFSFYSIEHITVVRTTIVISFPMKETEWPLKK